MTITLNEQKKAKMKASYQAVQHYETSITELIQLIVTLVSNMPGMQCGRLHYRNLEIERTYYPRGKIRASMRLSYPCTQEELVWWIENVDKSFNVISHGKPVIEIRTDASKKGWRVYLNGDATQGLWSGTESQLRANEIELKAILFALLAFGERPKNRHVKVLCDNSTAVTYINAMGGKKSPRSNQIAFVVRMGLVRI